jgi:hypothetical protein
MIEIIIKNQTQLGDSFNTIRDEFERLGEIGVTVKGRKESLSEGQRGYYWLCTGIIAKELGLTKEEQHLYFKEKFLLNIILGDPSNHPEFQQLVENLKIVRTKAPEQYPAIREWVISKISHLDATQDNMVDLITHVLSFGFDKKIALPEPKRKEITQKEK